MTTQSRCPEPKSTEDWSNIDNDQFAESVRRRYEELKLKYSTLAIKDVPQLWLEGVDPAAIYPQECFSRAYRYAVDLCRIEVEGIWLVHGECGLCFGRHAWVELPDALVFDGVFQQFFRIEDWEKHILGTAWYKYTPFAASLISANMPKMDDGTIDMVWDVKLNLPWFRGMAFEIDENKAIELITANGLREEANRQDARTMTSSRGR